MRKLVAIPPDLAQEVFTDALRCYVGRGKHASVDQCSEDTGMPARTLRRYLEGRATPVLAHLLTLCAYLPAEFVDKLLAPTGKGYVAELGKSDDCPLTLHECASRFSAEVAACLVDDLTPGRIDHMEMHRLDKTVDELASTIGKYRAARAQKKMKVVA